MENTGTEYSGILFITISGMPIHQGTSHLGKRDHEVNGPKHSRDGLNIYTIPSLGYPNDRTPSDTETALSLTSPAQHSRLLLIHLLFHSCLGPLSVDQKSPLVRGEPR